MREIRTSGSMIRTTKTDGYTCPSPKLHSQSKRKTGLVNDPVFFVSSGWA